MADLTISVDIDAKGTKSGADEAKRAVKSIGDEAQNTARKTQSLARVDYSAAIKQLKEYGSQIKNFGGQIQGFGQQLTVGVTLPIIGLGTAAIKTFADVELAVAGISTIKPEIDTKQIFSALNEMSTRIPQSAKELGDGLYNIFSSINVAPTEGLRLLEQFGKGATAAQTDAKTFGTAVLGVINAYKLSVEDAAHITDVFFNTVNLGVVDGRELANELGSVTQAAKNAGVSFDELGALIVGVTKEGGNASENINNLSNFLQKLPTKESSAALKQLGVDVQIDGKFRPVIDVLGDLKLKLDELEPSARALELQKIFPDSQARTGAQTLLSQLAAVKEALIVNQTTAGAADAAYKKIAATASVQFSLLKNSSIAILAELGSAILPVLQPLVIWLAQNLIPAVKQAVETFKTWSPQMQTVAVAIVAIVAAIGPVLVVLGTLISFVGSVATGISVLLPIFGAIGGAVAGLGGFIIAFIGLIGEAGLVASFSALASVLGGTVITAIGAFIEVLAPIAVGVAAIVAVIGVLIGIGVALYAAWTTNFGGLRDFTTEVFTTIQTAIQSGLAYIQNLWATYGGQIVATATNTFNSIIEFLRPIMTEIVATATEGFRAVVEIAGPLWTQLSTFIGTQLKIIAVGVKVVLAVISALWQVHGAQITAIVSAVWNIVKTIVITGVKIIGNAITLVLAIINGDWKQAWESAKAIVRDSIAALNVVLKSLGSLVYNAVAFVVSAIFQAGPAVAKAAYNVGVEIGNGLSNGIKSKAGEAIEAAKNTALGVISILRSVPIIRSPSRVTTEIGEQIGEGLAIGIENKISRAKGAAKKIADETIKALREAVKEFEKLAGASPQVVKNIQQTNRIKEGTSNQSEIINLRGELGVNQFNPLPTTVSATDRELKDLQAQKKAADEFNKSLEEISKTSREIREIQESDKKAFDEKILSIQQSGAAELLNLGEEIELAGVLNETTRQRIKDNFEILRLREQLANDGYGKTQIDEAAQVLRIEQARARELQRILDIRKQVADATELGKDLTGKLSDLQNANREISQYEITLKKINTDLRDISPAQKEFLLNTAAQIDAQKAFNEAYKKTYDFIRDGLDILIDSTKSFGERIKSFFGGILSSIKKLILDATAQFLTSKILSIFGQQGSGQSSGGGGFLDIIRGFFGGGANSGGSQSGISNLPNVITNLFGGNSRLPTGATNAAGEFVVNGFGLPNFNGIFNPGGNGAPIIGGSAGKSSGIINFLAQLLGGSNSRVSGGGVGGASGTLSSLFSAQGISSALASGGVTALIALAQYALTAPTPLKGLASGGLIGLGIGFINQSKLRRKEETLRTQYLRDAIAGLADFDKLILDLKNLRLDPDEAITQGKTLSDTLRAQYIANANTLKDKKTRNIALKSVSELDYHIGVKTSELQAAAGRARSASDVDKRLIPEFATGNFFGRAGTDDQLSEMLRLLDNRRGFIAGGQLGVDRHLGLFADGEAILNETQQIRINQAAGFDVLAEAGIPNYPKPKERGIARFETGAFFGQTASTSSGKPSSSSKQQINVTVVIQSSGMVESDIVETIVDSIENNFDVETALIKKDIRATERRRK